MLQKILLLKTINFDNINNISYAILQIKHIQL